MSPPNLETANTASHDAQELSIGDILRIFFHRRRVILGLTALFLLLTAAYFLIRQAASVKTSNWLTAQLAELKDKVADSERKVGEFQQKAGLVGVYVSAPSSGRNGTEAGSASQVSSPDDERLIALNAELTRAESERIGREALYRFAQGGDPEVLASLDSGSLTGSGAEGKSSTVANGMLQLQSLRQQETVVKLQYAAGLTKYGPRNPSF